MNYVKDLLKQLKPGINLDKLKKSAARKYKLKKIPTNIEILNLLNEKERKLYKDYFITKPVRTLSGVAPIAVMTKPLPCPHAKKGGPCSYCPGGPSSVFGDIPQSYTGKEPATMRGLRAGFDSYLQVFNRLEHYIVLGQVPEKVELIIMGGTFPSFEKEYQEEFVKYCFKALNDFSEIFYKKKFDYKKFNEFFELPCDVFNKERTKRIQDKLRKIKETCALEKEQERNETSKIRCVGLTIETRPDYGKLKEGNEMLRLGCTRVELGIQSVYDDVLDRIKRGHSVNDSIESIKILKDLGFKLNFHYMVGLPGIGTRELDGLKELFLNEDFKPDMLKLYPCMVMKGTELYKEWKKGKYKPLTTEKAAEVIVEFKRYVPEYCRIMRVQRDIPSYATEAGPGRTNLRQYVNKILEDKKIKCRCIRCREIGRNIKKGKVKLKVFEYKASKGKEFFISLEDDNSLYGFCRLRFPSEFLRKEITKDSALIRELHVYGELTELGEKGKVQHKGYGKLLLKKAEEISRKNKKNKIVVISGVGVREYYKKFGYKREDVYMVKKI